MKKTLLSLSFLAVAQLACAQYYINEVFVDPPNDDEPHEYFELRGPANGTFPPSTYLVQVDGDTENGNPGDLDNFDSGQPFIDLSNVALGQNGLLVIYTTQFDFGGSTGVVVNDYNIDPAAAVLQDVTDGDLEGQSHSFFLISTSDLNPPSSGDDIDADDDGIADPAGVIANWVIYDSVAFTDDDSSTPEYSYAQITFHDGRNNSPDPIIPAGSTYFRAPTQFDYAARVGNSTGYALDTDISQSDWIGGDVSSRDDSDGRPDWQFSNTAGNSIPDGFEGFVIESHIGSTNPSTTASNEDVNNFEFSLYPNPTNSIVNVSAQNKFDLDRVEIYSVLGDRVISHKFIGNDYSVNVSGLQTGVYLVRVKSNSSTAVKKLVIK